MISVVPNYMPNISDEVMQTIEELMVVVLQDSMDGHPKFYKPNSYKYQCYKYKDCVEQITMKQFFLKCLKRRLRGF